MEVRLVFLGLALDRQGRDEEAERVYSHARDVKPNDALALQGLITLFEKQATKKVDDYGLVARRLAEIHMKAYVRLLFINALEYSG